MAVSFTVSSLSSCTGEAGTAANPTSGEPTTKSAAATGKQGWPEELRVSAIPDVSQNDLLVKYPPLAEYLSTTLGVEVDFTPVTDYPATVDGLAANRLDLVWYGGYTSLQAVRQSKGNAERLVMRDEDKKFKSVFVASPQSGIKSLADLKGKKFAFGSQSSTSGHLMPRHFLAEAGIDPETDFTSTTFTGAHDATAKAVESGQTDAGALNFLVWEKLQAGGKVDEDKVAVFYTTPEYVDYCWVASKSLPEDLRQAIRKAFLDLDPSNPAHKAILDLQNASRFVEANDSEWKGIEEAARAADMLKD
jgi:phosphonate transport system substrate-binding protein